jgi:cyclophilin family peptidyl-prolyl cis-trans isomerase
MLSVVPALAHIRGGLAMHLGYLSRMVLAAALAAPAAGLEGADNPVVVIETSLGSITIEVYPDRAPKSVENFLGYVKDGFYEGTIFHRVIRGFMIQGGGLTADLQRKPTRAPVENEAANGLKNQRGTVAMARTAEIHSGTSQFFINTANNTPLDHKGMGARDFGYCVFGKVTEGMEVVDLIEKVKTGEKSGHRDVPVETVFIKSIRLKTE